MALFVLVLALALCVCGVEPLEERIVGGAAAPKADHKYEVSVRYKTTHICGGALVTKNRIVTAAHCVQKYESEVNSVTIQAETVQLTGDANAKTQEASAIFIHEMFAGGRDYDIAVVHVANNFAGSEPLQVVEADANFDAVDIILTGWGKPGTIGEFAKVLQLAKLKKLDCSKYFPQATERMLCVKGSKGVFGVACPGDSGSPLTAKPAADNRLVGIVASTGFCQRKGSVDVVVNLQNEEIRDFITKNTT